MKVPKDNRSEELLVRPWPDPVLDLLGYDPRSAYVDRFWVAFLGPATTFVLRRLAGVLDEQPDGARVDSYDLARSIGMRGRRGASAYLERALDRAGRFELVRREPDLSVAVRTRLAPLTRAQVARLPRVLQTEHREWEEARPSGFEAMRRRSRQLALSLIELGEDRDATERQLLRWRYHPSLAYESTVWAWTRHHVAARAAQEPHAPGAAGTAQSESVVDLRNSSRVRTPKPVAPLVV